jgi:SAM-dependent methyltransferase
MHGASSRPTERWGSPRSEPLAVRALSGGARRVWTSERCSRPIKLSRCRPPRRAPEPPRGSSRTGAVGAEPTGSGGLGPLSRCGHGSSCPAQTPSRTHPEAERLSENDRRSSRGTTRRALRRTVGPALREGPGAVPRARKAGAVAPCHPGPVGFDAIADEYELGRPPYPEAVYDALGPLSGALVLEGGAGTGIATDQLLQRGARVVAFDVSTNLLQRAARRIPMLQGIVADGACLPFRAGIADLLCFAQSWHWLDESRRCPEAARVLRPRGRWAGWWSHARADGEVWFEAYWDAIEAACPGVGRSRRDHDWGKGVQESGFFDIDERITITWVRTVTLETWLIEQRSHSFVAAMHERERETLLQRIERAVLEYFPTGEMTVPYETWLWVATKHRDCNPVASRAD